jgi:hypothetical protein
MAATTIVPTEDQTFNALFLWVAKVLDLPNNTPQIRKGFQNQVANPKGTYVIISPGIKGEYDFGARRYDADLGQQVVERHVRYSYQLDCYGPNGPDWASILSVAWRSMWGVDNMVSGALTPLYADAPEQVNIVNAQGQYEQRFKIRLHGQVNQLVGLPQDFFDEIDLIVHKPADLLP